MQPVDTDALLARRFEAECEHLRKRLEKGERPVARVYDPPYISAVFAAELVRRLHAIGTKLSDEVGCKYEVIQPGEDDTERGRRNPRAYTLEFS